MAAKGAVSPERRTQLAREICVAKGLDPDRDAEDVVAVADQDMDTWEECCEGGCEPCAADIQSAALALRRRLAVS